MIRAMEWHPEGLRFSLVSRYARSPFEHWGKLRLVRGCERFAGQPIMRFAETDGRIQIHFGDYVDWAVLTQGVYEPRSLSAALQIMEGAQDASVFLDVGAHHGIYSIAVAAATRCSVVAIEPSWTSVQVLTNNIRLNPALKIDVVNCCAAADETLLALTEERSGLSAWTKVQSCQPATRAVYTAGMRLDVLLDKLGVNRVRLMKIDVEGYETSVFKGFTWSGPRRPEYILMECDPLETEKRQFLLDRGYVAQTVERKSTDSLTRYPEGNLLFIDVTRVSSAQA